MFCDSLNTTFGSLDGVRFLIIFTFIPEFTLLTTSEVMVGVWWCEEVEEDECLAMVAIVQC